MGPLQPVNGRTSKNDMARYLEAYAAKFDLPILTGQRITGLHQIDSGYLLETQAANIQCSNVVVATGNGVKKIPSFAAEISPEIIQIHSSEYKNEESLPEGDVLVVGGAASGIEIALEISRKRKTQLSGEPTFILPAILFKLGKFNWWISKHVLSTRTPIGRKARPGFLRGGAIMPMLYERLNQSQVIRRPRLAGVKAGLPQCTDGEVIRPHIIIWCTGFQPDHSWIKFQLKTEFGWPLAKRGVVQGVKGLYMLGMPFQHNATSHLVYGVGSDAKYIAKQIKRLD